MYLQEIKCSSFGKDNCYLLYVSNDIECFENDARNNAGGIITIWRMSCFQITSSFNRSNYSVIEDEWKVGSGIRGTIVNVYCSGSLRERKLLWDEIFEIRKLHKDMAWCIVGDFNTIRRKEERKNMISSSDYSREITCFNNFIQNSKLVDIPMVGRKFTWYKPNGSIKSIIDRVLVFRELLDV